MKNYKIRILFGTGVLLGLMAILAFFAITNFTEFSLNGVIDNKFAATKFFQLLTKNDGGGSGIGFFQLLTKNDGGGSGIGFFQLLTKNDGGGSGIGLFRT